MPSTPYSKNEGFKILDGHCATQRWQAVQCALRCAAECDPGGLNGLLRIQGLLVPRCMPFAQTCELAASIVTPMVARKRRREATESSSEIVVAGALFFQLNSYRMAFLVQTVVQLKQVTQRLLSTVSDLLSMQDALQFLAQMPQWLQLSSCTLKRNMEKRETKPRMVPNEMVQMP